MRKYLRGKIHRARVTDANLDYEGSISIPTSLMETLDLAQYEAVNVWNVNQGHRLETYAIKGPENQYILNGAAAHKFNINDIIIIAWWEYCYADQLIMPAQAFINPIDNTVKRIFT